MKKKYSQTSLILLMIFFTGFLKAQTPTVQDCLGAIPLCGPVYSELNAYSGVGNYSGEINSALSCLNSGEKNDVWYIFTVQSDGELGFSITPNNMSDDYDWAVFNLTNAKCDEIRKDGSLQASCNYSGSPGVTGPNGLPGGQNNPLLNVLEGETYVVNVSQFSSSPNGYTIDFSMSTADIYDDVAPLMEDMAVPALCGASEVSIHFSENILCNTVDVSNFELQGADTYNITTVTSPQCDVGAEYGNTYTFHFDPPMRMGKYKLFYHPGGGSDISDNCGNSPTTDQMLQFETSSNFAVVATPTDITCSGADDGQIVATAAGAGGTALYSIDYGVNFFDNGGVFTGITSGEYAVLVKDAYECVGMSNLFEIVDPPALFITNEEVIDVTCAGWTDGQINISAEGGTGRKYYSIDAGANFYDNNGFFTGLTPNFYDIIVKDANDCPTVGSTLELIAHPSVLLSDTELTHIDCNGNNNGEIVVTAHGGSPPLEYAINGGAFQTTNNFTNLFAGYYNVQVRDANNCVTSGVTVSVTEPPSLEVRSALVENIECWNSDFGSIRVVGQGGTGNYQFSLNGVDYQPTGVFEGLTAGSYQVDIQDEHACSVETTVLTVTNPFGLSVDHESSTDISCNAANDGTITVSVSGGTGNFELVLGPLIQPTGTFTGLAGGTFVVDVHDQTGCSISSNTLFIVNPAPVEITNELVTHISCHNYNDGSIAVSAVGGTGFLSYAINGGEYGATTLFTDLPEGVYSISVMDVNSCGTTGNSLRVENPTELIINEIKTENISCSNADDGRIIVSASGGTANLRYSLDAVNFQDSNVFTGLVAGTYTVTVADVNNCQKRGIPVTITNPFPIGLNTQSSSDLSCFAANDGQILVTASGGTGNLQYTLNTIIQDHGIFKNLAAGTYHVIVSDERGCTRVTNDFQIKSPAEITLKTDLATDVTCNGYDDASILVEAEGGVGGFSYSLNGAAFLPNGEFTGLNAGNYTITIQDSDECSITTNHTVINPAAIDINSLTHNQISCHDYTDGLIKIRASGGTGDLLYSLDNETFIESGNFLNLSEGIYVVTIKDDNACERRTEPITILNPTGISIDSEYSSHLSCNGENNGTIVVTASGGTGNLQYVVDTRVQDNGTFENLSTGSYQVIISDEEGCFTASNEFVIENHPVIVINSENSTDISCHNFDDGMIEVVASGGNGQLWYSLDGGALQDNGIFRELEEGTYKVSVTDNNVCTEVTDNLVVVNPAQVVINQIQPSGITCYGETNGSITVFAGGGTANLSYSIDDKNFQYINRFTNLASGRYLVTVKDENECSVMEETTVIGPAFPMKLEAKITHVNCHEGIDGAIDLKPTGGSPDYTFIWSSNHTTEDIDNLEADEYTVIVTDLLGCSASLTAEVTQPEAPLELTINQTDITCFGEDNGSIDLSVTGGTTDYRYEWSNELAMEDIVSLPPGKYVVKVTDANNCFEKDSAVIYEPPILELTYAPTDVRCFGGSDGMIDITVKGGTQDYSFAWSNDAITEDVTGLLPGQYTITVTDANACYISELVTIEEPLVIQSSYSTTFSCYGAMDGTVDLTVEGGITPYKFLWSNGEQTEDLSFLDGGTYQVTVTDFNECKYTTEAVVVEPDPLDIHTKIVNSTCKELSDAAIEVETFGGIAPYRHEWLGRTEMVAKLTDIATGFYSLRITDAHNCIFNQEFEITPAYDECVSVVSAFTPNDDGINDTWIIRGIQAFPKAEVVIYDRTGRLLTHYKSTDKPWDGTFNHVPLPVDTYYYVIKLYDGPRPILKGTVTIVR